METASSSKRVLKCIAEKKEIDCHGFELEHGKEPWKDSCAILLSRANSNRTCFYTNLSLKSLRNFKEKRDCQQKVKEEDHMGHEKAEMANADGKVRPICDATAPAGTDCNGDATVNKKRKVISRMKELLRWAAAAKSDKGLKRWKVLYFRNKGTVKDTFDETSSGSSKISFTWDLGSCSAGSSALSPLSLQSTLASRRTSTNQQLECISEEMWVGQETDECARIGNWITTDSEFVVLEL